MTMNAIADWLTGSGESDRPILDQTGLNGTFDFILEFDPESLGREGVSNVPHEDSGPTLCAVSEVRGREFNDCSIGLAPRGSRSCAVITRCGSREADNGSSKSFAPQEV
jgi:hypothetical protein